MTLTSIICTSLLLVAPQSGASGSAKPPTTKPATTTTQPVPVGGRNTVTIVPSTKPRSTTLPPYREIWASCWRPVPAGCTLLTQQIRVEGAFFPAHPATSLASRPNAAAVAAQTKALPNGRAALMWWRYSNSLFYPDSPGANAPALSTTSPRPWDANAVTAVSQEWTAWLQEFKNAGGKMDYLIGDCERWGLFLSWSLTDGQIQQIASDPRASQPYYNASPLTTLVSGASIAKVKAFTQTTDYMKWDCAMGTLTAASMKRAVWDPAAALFPSVRGSNYAGIRMTDKPAPDINGHPHPWNNVVGTAASPVAYGQMEGVSTGWFIDPVNPTQLSKTGSKRLDRTPWNAFLLDVQSARGCKRSAPELPLQPWIAIQSWRGRIAGLVPYPNDLRYHDEMLRHYAVLGTEVFLYWNPEAAGLGPDARWTETDRTNGAVRLNGVLAEINSRTDGVVIATATVQPLALDARVVTSGAQRRDGKWIWRTTAKPDVARLRNTQTGAVVGFDASGVGRWDLTDTNVAPIYVPDTTQASLVNVVETRRP